MDVNQRVKLTIGDLVIEVQALSAKIEELEAKLKELEAAKPSE